MTGPQSANRLQYLDWLRGLAAVIMLQGHVFDSFTRTDLRTGGPFVLSQFVGGLPPAIFLFLTGITLAFLMDSSERKGLAPRERVFTAFKRAGFLFLVAYAFRLQLWLFAWPVSPWTDLLKVDILNCMGFAIAMISVMALFRAADRARLCGILGLAIAFLSPLVSQLDWTRVPQLARHYIAPDYLSFGFFPWAAYLAFGVSAGSIIRAAGKEGIERLMQWTALTGGAMVLASEYFANLPYSIYSKSEYWLDSPAQVLTKLGITLLLLAGAFLWTRYAAGQGWSWVRQLGTTSLPVYWVHIELVYGRWLGFFKSRLSVGETVATALVVILAMLALSVIRTNWDRLRIFIAELAWWFGAKAGRPAED
jgi:uncharacterized membrane protein